MKRITRPKLSAILLCALLVVFIAAGCGSASPAASNTASGNEATSNPVQGTPEPTETPASAKDLFSADVVDVICDYTGLTSTLGSLQLDSLIDPDAAFDPSKSSDTQFTITLYNEEEGTEYNIIQQLLYDGTTGDTARTTEMKSGEETSSSSGWYFKGNDVYVVRMDTDEPMIHHTIGDSSGMQTASAYERIDMLLCGKNKKLTAEEWTAGAGAYADSLAFTADGNYAVEEAVLTLAGEDRTVSANTLMLTGTDAHTALYGVIDLLSSDSSYATYLDSICATLDAMDDSAKAGLSLQFIVYSNETGAIGARVVGTSADGSGMNVTIFSYRDGSIRDDRLYIQTFAGETVSASAKNISADSGYYATITYNFNDPSNNMTETLSMEGPGTISEDGSSSYQFNLNYGINFESDGEYTNYTVSGPADYASVDTETGTDTSISINAMNLSTGDEPQAISMDISISQNFVPVTVTPPQFLEAAGVSTHTSAELYEALGQDAEDYADFHQAPLTLRMVTGAILA
ncbi:MAG: hypothetical protein EOM54_02090 [Clostridia bacterium]|nr:hypothetical protein [Clostridia bacterium]